MSRMDRRSFLQGIALVWATTKWSPAFSRATTSHTKVISADGTAIAIETSGAGPSLVLVHGGVGDHTRWQKVLPRLNPQFTVFAMDRRGHGASGDSKQYSLQREAEDIAAVINSRPSKVNVLAH